MRNNKIIKNMMNSKKWPQSKYFGQTPAEIKALWKKNNCKDTVYLIKLLT